MLMQNQLILRVLATLLFAALPVAAQTSYYKADNHINLDQAGSWTNNTTPTASDWAVWNAQVATAANCTNENIGSSVSWGGIQILDPATAITITNTGKTLTLGSLGIDMNESNSTADLYLGVPLTVPSGAPQSWNLAPGRALNFVIGTGSSIQVGSDLSINGIVRFDAKDLRIGAGGPATVWLTNANTLLDFSRGALSFTVGYGNNCTVNQTAGKVNLYKSSTSTGALLLGANGGGSTGIYNLNGGAIVDTNTVNDYFSIGDGSANVGILNVKGGTIVVPQFQIGNNGYGYVNVSNGAIVTAGADMLVNKGNNSLGGYLNVYGGTVSIPGHNLVVGRGGSSTFANSGNVYLANTGIINVGSAVQIPGAGANPGVVTLDGGALNVTNNVTFLNSGSSGNGTLNLNGGMLTANAISVSTGTGVAAFNFNGGTLRARANNGNFVASGVPLYVQAGGAVIDSAGFNITIAAPLLNGTGGGPDGGVTKLGVGQLMLAGPAGSYNGPTLIGAGTLTLTTTNHAGGAIIVSNTATLHTTLANAGDTMNVSSLTLGAMPSDNVTEEFDLNGFGNPSVAVIHATNLTLNGTVTMNIFASTNLMPGVIPLVKYDSSNGSATFVLNFAQGIGGFITNDSSAQTIELVAQVLPTVIWRALADTNWDETTFNWVSAVDGLPTKFSNGAGTLFDDSASNSLVNLTAAMSPTTVLVSNNILNYTFTGPGKISGSTGLTKQGDGVLTLALTNDYAGATIISNGVFRYGMNNVIPSGSETTVEGKLDLAGFSGTVHALNGSAGMVDNSGASPSVLTIGGNGGSFAGVITNSGVALALNKSGGSLYLLNAINSYSGGTTNGSGLLQLASEHSIGSGPLALNGGTLAWSDSLPHTITNVVTMGNGGVTLGSPTNANGLLTITRVVDFLGAAHGVTCNQDALFVSGMTNGALTSKSGPNTLFLKNTVADWNGGSLSVNGGTLILDGGSVTQDGSNIRIQCNTNAIARLVITNGATLTMAGSSTVNFRFADSSTAGTDATNIVDLAGTLFLTPYAGSNLKVQMGSSTDNPGQNILNLLPGGVLVTRQVLDLSPNSTSTFNFNGGTLRAATNDYAAVFMQGLDNAFVLDGGAIIDTAGFNVTVGQALLQAGTGVGGLTKQGAGILYLSGVNTYTGPTLVNAGGLAGTGSLNSPVTVAPGASLLAGPAPTVIGTFSINNSVTLNAGSFTVMKITKIAGMPSSDNLAGVSTMNYGGTLIVVTNADMTDALVAGDTFPLFSAANYNGSFTDYELPTLPAGLAWDTGHLAVDGTLRVVTAPSAPPAFTAVSLHNGNLILSGTNGAASSSYRVLATTNVALPLSAWTVIATNHFGADGSFNFTNTVDAAEPSQFFEIVYP